jgi:hypothetical protein
MLKIAHEKNKFQQQATLERNGNLSSNGYGDD